MLTPVKIGLGFIGMFVLLITFALTRTPDNIRVSVASSQENQFDDAWTDIMKPLALKKGDLERQRVAVPEPKVVATVPVPVDAVEESEPIAPALTVGKKVKAMPAKQRGHSDICQRHNMRKVTIGKRWRCRKK